MIKPLIAILLALTTSNAIADNIFIYEDNGQKSSNTVAGSLHIYKEKSGQVLLTNVHPSGSFDKFTKKVKVTSYRDSKGSESNQKQTRSGMQNVTHGRSSNSNSASYANSAYVSLR